MKVAVRRGHQYTGQDQGADGIVKEIDVAEKYYKLALEGFKSLGHEVLDVTPPDANRTLSDSLLYGINMANNWGADLFVSCHVNNAYDSYRGSLGCEVIYAVGSSSGEKYATSVENQLSSLGFKSRGAKADVRGLAELIKTNMPAIIVEPFFVEATSDIDVYNSVGDKGIANAIVKGVTGKDIPSGGNGMKYVVTNYLPEGQYGVEINAIIKKYFSELDRLYVRSNDTGIWIETQNMPEDKANSIAQSLKSDNLFWSLEDAN